MRQPHPVGCGSLKNPPPRRAMSRQRSDFARREIADCRYSASKFNDFWRSSEIVVDIADARVSDKRHAEQAAEKRGASERLPSFETLRSSG
ncbi:MAG: hypothetical protein WB710_01395 [Stellaceae bacterium]